MKTAIIFKGYLMTFENIRAALARWFGVFAIAAVLSIAGQSAFAQDAAEEDADDDLENQGFEEITVTGSRIKRNEFNTAAPIQVITNERSQLAGLLDSTDILQNSTVASGQQIDNSFSGFVTDGGVGANSISLRGLGAQRTLVLVNGKRWGPSGVRGSTNSVDLTALPTSQIARYEILKDGASSVYGADAVAGVVNAITKERIDGSSVNAQFFTPENGGSAYSLDGIWGRVGDNWSFNISAVYGEREETIRNDQDYASCDTRPQVDGGTNDENGDPLCYGFIYGLQSGPFGFARYEPSLSDPNDTTNPYYDADIQTEGIPFWTRIGVTDDPNQGPYYRDTRNGEVANIEPKGTTYSVNSFGDYDFSIADRNATAYYEFYYNHRDTEAVGGYRQFFPRVGANNPTNIMGTVLGSAALAVLPSYELQNPANEVSIDRTNTFIGLKGDISSAWTYDAYVGYSYSDGTYEQDNWLQGQVDASLDAELDVGGNLVCSAASLADYPGCVAGNLFTEDALLRGILPQDYIDFISKRTVGQTEYTSYQFAGYVTGPVYELPAGELQMVFGYEFRNEKIDDVPDDEFIDDNLWGRTSSGFTGGEDDVNEFFVEAEIPMFSDTVLAEEFSINASWRYTDYKSYGADDTYRVAVNWQVRPSVRLRATKGTSFRAPDLFEQFLANETGFVNAFGRDVCINYGENFDPTTTVYQNCMSEGLATDFGSAGTPSIRTVTGGNDELKAETSDSWSAGFIVTPESVNVSVAMSWFDIKLKNTVSSPTAGFILGDCYNSAGFSSPFCQRVSPRDVDGFLTDVDSSLLNVGLQRSKGFDIDILYQREFSSFDLTIDLTATHIEKQERVLLGQFDDFKGRWGFPEWVGQADVRLDYKDWTLFYNLEWIGTTSEVPVENFICGTDQETYSNLSLRYRGQSDWEIIGTLRNLSDNKPPIVSRDANCNSQSATRAFNTIPGAGYDLIGRAFALQVSKGFDF